jgi:hypothetical protein
MENLHETFPAQEFQHEIIGQFGLYFGPVCAGSCLTRLERLAFGSTARNTNRYEFIRFNP